MLRDDHQNNHRIDGGCSPSKKHGDVLPISSDAYVEFSNNFHIANARIADIFGVDLSGCFDETSKELDHIVSEMWEEGWSPSEGNANLFITDFGLILANSMIQSGYGELVLRSESDPSYASIWDSQHNIEYFPFLKVADALCSRDDSSIVSFAL